LVINKARVAGIDKDSTKTAEDRIIELCPRALNVLRRQLVLRSRLERAGRIDHDHLFFKASGKPIRNLQYPYTRWRQTLARLRDVRYRKPYCARHTSVSWDLMIGRSALWVARQHGHSIATMLRFYAAWADGALESDIDAIRATLNSERPLRRRATPGSRRLAVRPIARPFEMEFPLSRNAREARFASGFATVRSRPAANSLNSSEKIGGERGIRTLEGLLTLTPLAGVRLRPLGHLSAHATAAPFGGAMILKAD